MQENQRYINYLILLFTLDDYVVQSNYINLGDINHYDGHTNLRTIRLKYLNLEEGHEKHTEVYDEGLCNDNPEIDYGFLVDFFL